MIFTIFLESLCFTGHFWCPQENTILIFQICTSSSYNMIYTVFVQQSIMLCILQMIGTQENLISISRWVTWGKKVWTKVFSVVLSTIPPPISIIIFISSALKKRFWCTQCTDQKKKKKEMKRKKKNTPSNVDIKFKSRETE